MQDMKIDEMINTLNKLITSKYYIIIFFYDYQRKSNKIEEHYHEYCKEKFYKYENIKIIFLKSDFTEWWNQDRGIKSVLYSEMCNGFLKACSDLNITFNK